MLTDPDKFTVLPETIRMAALISALHDLDAAWQHRARCKFADAEHEQDPMGRRLIQHGACCYFNASQELREVMARLDRG